MAINWKEAARNYRFRMIMADEQERRLKRRLWQEREQRVRFVNVMSEIVPQLGIYGPWCRGCDSRWDDGAHDERCVYVRALTAIYEAGTEPEARVNPIAITFTCHHCGEFFDEPMELFIATASVAVLAPMLCKNCGHGGED